MAVINSTGTLHLHLWLLNQHHHCWSSQLKCLFVFPQSEPIDCDAAVKEEGKSSLWRPGCVLASLPEVINVPLKVGLNVPAVMQSVYEWLWGAFRLTAGARTCRRHLMHLDAAIPQHKSCCSVVTGHWAARLAQTWLSRLHLLLLHLSQDSVSISALIPFFYDSDSN